MSDYIPQSDALFNEWQATLLKIILANFEAWGILEDDVNALVVEQTKWTKVYAVSSNINDRKKPDINSKTEEKGTYKQKLRKFIAQWLSNNAKVPNSEKLRMGLTIKSETRTTTPDPTTFPVIAIDFSISLEHHLNIVDSETPLSKAKPDGIIGCEVWSKLDEKAQFSYVGISTRTPYMIKYEDSNVATRAYYRLRWINTLGVPGPWGPVVNALIMG
jgi:hypothetical protein